MKKVGKKELFDIILEVLSEQNNPEDTIKKSADFIIGSTYDEIKPYLKDPKNKSNIDGLMAAIKSVGEDKLNDILTPEQLDAIEEFIKKKKENDLQDQKSAPIDEKFQDALKKYDEKRAKQREKITDQTKKAEFDKKTKTVRNALLRAFEKKFPQWEPSDESKEIIDVEKDLEKYAKENPIDISNKLVLTFFPGINVSGDDSVLQFLSLITDSLLKSFESSPLIDSEEKLQEGFSGSNIQKFFRKVMFKDTTLGDAKKFYREFIMSIMEPINKAGIEYVQSTQGESSVKYIKNVVYKSKEIFEQAQENLIKSLGGNFNERIGKVSRYARKIGVEEFKSRLTKLGEAIAEKIDFGPPRLVGDRFQSLYGVDERKDSLLRKLGELFKSQSLSEEIKLPELDPERLQMRNPEEVDPEEDPFSDPETTPPDEKTEQLAMLLMNSYGRNVKKEKVISILTQIQDAFEYRVDYEDLEKVFKEMGIPKKEKEEGEKPYYFIDENEVMKKFAETIFQQKTQAGIEEAKTKLDSSFKVFVELYSNQDFFLLSLGKTLNKYEIETLTWYLSDKKRFASFMNKYFKNDSLYQKAIKLKSPIFKKLFSNIKNLRFDAEGEIFDLEKKTLDDLKKQGPSGLDYQLSDKSKVKKVPSETEDKPKKQKTGWEVSPFKNPFQIKFEEAIKPIVEETILEMLEK